MAGQERKAALNLAFSYPRATIVCGGSANSSRQVGTQTVRNLHPHPTAALGCVEWDEKNKPADLLMVSIACLPYILIHIL
jgi:hypothetical protein